MNKELIYVPGKPNSLFDILFCHVEKKKHIRTGQYIML